MAPAIRFSVLAILAVILVLFLAHECASQLTLTPSTSTLCPGDEVNLVCHHPLVATNAQTMRYLIPTPAWRENGSTITPAPGTTYQATTASDFMSTTLNFTISAEQFNESSYYYDCFLALAGGGLETSENATLVISELSSPVLTSITSLESSIIVEWLTVDCARSYSVSWQCVEPSSTGSNSTTNTNIIVSVNGSTEFTLRLVAVYGDSSTGPVTTAVVHSGYPRPTDNRCTSTSPDLILTCQFEGVEYTDIQWTSSRGPINSSDDQLTLNYTTLRDGTTFQCSGVEMGTIHRVRGDSYRYNVLLIVCSAIVGSSEPPEQSPDHGPLSSGQDRTLIIVLSAAAAVGGLLLVVVTLTAVLMVVCVLRSKSRSPVRTSRDGSSCSSTVSGTPQPAAGNDIDMMNNPVYVPMECLRAGNRKEGVSEPGPIYVNL